MTALRPTCSWGPSIGYRRTRCARNSAQRSRATICSPRSTPAACHPKYLLELPPAGWRKVRDGGGRDVWASPDGNQWWTANTVPKGGVTLLAVSPFPVSTHPPRSARSKGLVLRPADAVLTRSLSESTALRLEYLLINTPSDRWKNLADDTSTLAIFADTRAPGFHVFGVGDSLPDLDPNESITLTGSMSDDLALGTHRVIADLVDLGIRAETETTLTLVP